MTTNSPEPAPTTLPLTSAEPTDVPVGLGSTAQVDHGAVVDRRASASLAQAVVAAEVRGMRRLSLAIGLDRLELLTRARVLHVLRQVLAVDAGERLTDATLADIAVDLRDKDIRDLLFVLPYTEHASAADQLWTELAMRLSGRDRAEPATLLAYSAYVGENTDAAESAVAMALDADAEHSIADLLAVALAIRMPARRLRRLAEKGCAAAQDMGITITLRA